MIGLSPIKTSIVECYVFQVISGKMAVIDHKNILNSNFTIGLFISIFFVVFFLISGIANSQDDSAPCPDFKNSRADKVYDKAIKLYQQRNYSESIRMMNEVTDIEPDYVDAYFVLGLIYIKESRMNLKSAKENFQKVIDICPDYDVYAYYYLSKIAYGAQDYQAAYDLYYKISGGCG